MNLIRAILLLIFLITPLKANTIYNLIKIPNLEIYEINTKNKLRYLYAARPFQLGTQKNIVCSNPNEKDLELKYKIILKNLNRYSYDYLKKINLKYIVMCENLSISELYTAGIPDNIMKTLILDIKFNEKYFERVIHHEVFHVMHLQHKNIFNEEEWAKFNNFEFKYAECSTCTKNISLEKYQETDGFFTEYSKSTASEDMAEVYSHMIFLKKKEINQIRKLDPILNNKISYIENKIKEIDNSFTF
ncbi:putative zinc-binding metallopeptidase [Candidatus Pelagibacter ubique]|nr:putative zinc-binding metallopeptidase [Candidatus Pelagibacter ubique]MDA7478903.1 putative zinc-binding metallopeptidase [Candidatus Pelagibacter ubique]MDC1152072.1 putative zinc-binding metallopeptidase [Candidatus Pelagibacter ubique]